MYFSADTGDGFHLWRQRYPNGEPEQITFGPDEDEGIAIAPSGRGAFGCTMPKAIGRFLPRALLPYRVWA
jgi:hypothetical protein